jgi:hypothetical protein
MSDELTIAGARDVGPLGSARMSGLSIAGRDAAPWATDFLAADQRAFHRAHGRERVASAWAIAVPTGLRNAIA